MRSPTPFLVALAAAILAVVAPAPRVAAQEPPSPYPSLDGVWVGTGVVVSCGPDESWNPVCAEPPVGAPTVPVSGTLVGPCDGQGECSFGDHDGLGTRAGCVAVPGDLAAGVEFQRFFKDQVEWFGTLRWDEATGQLTGTALLEHATWPLWTEVHFTLERAGDVGDTACQWCRGVTGPYVDVAWDHAFCADIAWMASAGIARNLTIPGWAGDTFRPADPLSRQALAAYLYRMAGRPDGDPPSCAAPPATDVPVDHPFCGEIAWAMADGIAAGYPDGTYRPTHPVTRQAMAAMLYRLAGAPLGADPGCADAPFSDVPVDHPFCGEIAWAASAGITAGYADGRFRPGQAVSRQATAAMLRRWSAATTG